MVGQGDECDLGPQRQMVECTDQVRRQVQGCMDGLCCRHMPTRLASSPQLPSFEHEQ